MYVCMEDGYVYIYIYICMYVLYSRGDSRVRLNLGQRFFFFLLVN